MIAVPENVIFASFEAKIAPIANGVRALYKIKILKPE